MANASESEVIAADGFAFFPSSNKGFVADGRKVTLTVGATINSNDPKIGSFHRFTPGGTGRLSAGDGPFSSITVDPKTGLSLRFNKNAGKPIYPLAFSTSIKKK